MKRYFCALALLPFLAAPAFAAPVALNDSQMDNVNAGWSLFEKDYSNTSFTVVSVYSYPIDPYCGDFYINVVSPALSVASQFGPAYHYD